MPVRRYRRAASSSAGMLFQQWILMPSQWMPFAVGGALCMGTCSLLSNKFPSKRSAASHRRSAAGAAVTRPQVFARRSNIVYPSATPVSRCAAQLLERASCSVFPDGLRRYVLARRGCARRSRACRGYAGFWLKAFSQATIDLTLRTHAGLRTRIVESPGLSLSQPELDELVSQLRLVAGQDAAGRQTSPTASSLASANVWRAPSSR